MTEITCETQGHLWNSTGKCVMCGTPRPIEQLSSNQHVCPRCGLPIAYGEKQVGNTECGVAHTPERCCALLRMARASSGAEIERLRARRDELDRANVGLATESERLRAALNTALRCLQAALGPGWEVKPLPADEREKEHG